MEILERLENIKMDICTNPLKIKAQDIVWLIETLENEIRTNDEILAQAREFSEWIEKNQESVTKSQLEL